MLLILDNLVNGIKVGRNNPCFCNSGKKSKKCHLNVYLQLERIGDKGIFLKEIENLRNDSKTLDLEK